MTPEQRIADDLGLTTADLEQIVRAERARRLGPRMITALRTLSDRGGHPYDRVRARAAARTILAEIDRPV